MAWQVSRQTPGGVNSCLRCSWPWVGAEVLCSAYKSRAELANPLLGTETIAPSGPSSAPAQPQLSPPAAQARCWGGAGPLTLLRACLPLGQRSARMRAAFLGPVGERWARVGESPGPGEGGKQARLPGSWSLSRSPALSHSPQLGPHTSAQGQWGHTRVLQIRIGGWGPHHRLVDGGQHAPYLSLASEQKWFLF